MMTKILVIVILITITSLHDVESKRGRCMRRNGSSKCLSTEICLRGRRLNRYKRCDPINSHSGCRCKEDTVTGCTNIVGESICADDELCVLQNGNLCPNRKRRKSKCSCQHVATTTPTTIAPGLSCPVAVGTSMFHVPLGARGYQVPSTCKQCDCLDFYGFGYPPFYVYCRDVLGCVDFQLTLG